MPYFEQIRGLIILTVTRSMHPYQMFQQTNLLKEVSAVAPCETIPDSVHHAKLEPDALANI